MERYVGAGGWGYFDVPGEDRLVAYAKAFPFVEVNATFYQQVDPRTATRWRRRVPAGFRFSVRTHRDLTHRGKLRATPLARASFARTAKIADVLGALAIVLETPASLPIEGKETAELRELVRSTDLRCPVALEARAYAGRPLPSGLRATMEDLNIADVVDYSREAPRTDSSVVYGRLFGLGEHNRWEFTDDELLEAQVRAESRKGDHVLYAFHGVRMYKDAARFLTYVRSGKFPRATQGTGLASLEEVLGEDASFPATKEALLRDHGWRVIDLAPDRRSHASELLEKLADKRFQSAQEVRRALQGGLDESGLSRSV